MKNYKWLLDPSCSCAEWVSYDLVTIKGIMRGWIFYYLGQNKFDYYLVPAKRADSVTLDKLPKLFQEFARKIMIRHV